MKFEIGVFPGFKEVMQVVVVLALIVIATFHVIFLIPSQEKAVLPTLCIVVLFHSPNDAALLPRAVFSLQAQSYPHWTAILVDDSARALRPPVFNDPRITLIRLGFMTVGGEATASNIGFGACLNSGADAIGVLHADDHYIDASALATAASALASSNGAPVIFAHEEHYPSGDIKRVEPCLGSKSDVHCKIPPFLKFYPRDVAKYARFCEVDTLFEDTCLHYNLTADQSNWLVRDERALVARTMHAASSLSRVPAVPRFLFFLSVYDHILAQPWMQGASDDVLYSIIPRLKGALPPNNRHLSCLFERTQDAIRSRMRTPSRLPASKRSRCKTPEVCVVTPVHNDLEYVLKEPWIQHVVVDDHSKPPIESAIPSHFRGAGRARNLGISACDAPFVAFVDADDRIDVDCLRKTVAMMKSSGGDLSIARYANVPGGMFAADERALAGNGTVKDRAYRTIAYPWTKVATLDLARSSVFGTTPVHNDLPFHLDIIGQAGKVAFSVCTLIHHRRTDSSRLTFRKKGRGKLRDAWALAFRLMRRNRQRPRADDLQTMWTETWRFAAEKAGNASAIAADKTLSHADLRTFLSLSPSDR